ncbi:MAG: glucosamine-6-phosphate deaminase [Planctomycetota bacterium]
MKVIKVETPQEMGKVAAQIVAEQMRAKPHCVLGLATGGTPVPLYNELIRLHTEEDLDFSTTITFNLDEYVDLPVDHPESYRRFMDDKLFNHVNIPKANTHVPNGNAEDMELEALQYEAWIEDLGGVDLQVLGIGHNGHIGFAEPGSSLASRTRVVKLTESTRKANARFFDDNIDNVPTHAITMGIGTILEAGMLLMLAAGGKAQAIQAALEGPISAACPASALQLHPEVTCILAEDAASQLTIEFQS